eukprot:GHVS01070294.1.p1 GENE.GHVS01070294.1~~GHVS01070294.1.p1  ORF type:complete len:131 (-),score=34.52 GHVS01070294.1:176-568(-)
MSPPLSPLVTITRRKQHTPVLSEQKQGCIPHYRERRKEVDSRDGGGEAEDDEGMLTAKAEEEEEEEGSAEESMGVEEVQRQPRPGGTRSNRSRVRRGVLCGSATMGQEGGASTGEAAGCSEQEHETTNKE